FKQIDYAFLDGFKRKLVKDGVKPNTIGNYLRSIRAIYNKAIKFKIVDRSFYPFTEIQIRTDKTAKRGVTKQDIVNLSKLDLKPNSRQWHARNYFLLSFSLRGMSFTDMAYLKPDNISKDILTYRRRKTHKNYTIKLLPIAKSIFTQYGTRNLKYLLPVLPITIQEDSLEAKKLISQWIKTSNKWLKKIGETSKIEQPLTTYVARHTWATTAKRLGYSNELIAEAMGHEYGNRITNIYLDSFEQSVIDEVNQKVTEHLKIK
ncbi:MAG TPA: phage integrase SAM-like domain-containing protein, partial [Sphingobacteriaceae bacterium]